MTQITDVPTCPGNTLDLIVTNHPNQINRTQTLPGISDHVKQLSDDNHRAKFHCITNRLARFPPIHLGNSRQYCAEQDDVFR